MISKIFKLGVFIWLVILAFELNKVKKDLLELKKEKQEVRSSVKVTTYTTDTKQTDNTPYITASGFKLSRKNPKHHRIVAVSRDIKKRLNFGDKIKLTGIGKYDGIYRVEDVMNKRFRNRIDILINPEDRPISFDDVKMIVIK